MNAPAIMDRFMNLHCLETNVMEGTLQFNESVGFPFDRNITYKLLIFYKQVSTKLVLVGFFNQLEPVDGQSLTGGAVRSRADALSVLQDTHQVRSNALDLFSVLKAFIHHVKPFGRDIQFP